MPPEASLGFVVLGARFTTTMGVLFMDRTDRARKLRPVKWNESLQPG
jgi:hypothetical protein